MDPGAVPPFANPDIAGFFAACPKEALQGLMQLRALIFHLAQDTPGVGVVEEALRWGQPAYLTAETDAGTTLRLGLPKAGGFALYAHCRTTVIQTFADRFGDDYCYEGNRAVLFQTCADIQPQKISLLIVHALTYHLRS